MTNNVRRLKRSERRENTPNLAHELRRLGKDLQRSSREVNMRPLAVLVVLTATPNDAWEKREEGGRLSPTSTMLALSNFGIDATDSELVESLLVRAADRVKRPKE
jgi:hypothetical protein